MSWKASFSVELSCGDGMGGRAYFCIFDEHFDAENEEEALEKGVQLEHYYNRSNRGVVRCCFDSLAPVTTSEQLGETLPRKRVIDARLRSYADRDKNEKEST